LQNLPPKNEVQTPQAQLFAKREGFVQNLYRTYSLVTQPDHPEPVETRNAFLRILKVSNGFCASFCGRSARGV
jgi:hypothetical protein